jgi:hypothetical protein
MKTYNREKDPSIIEIDKNYLDNLPKYQSDFLGESKNTKKKKTFKKVAAKNRSGEIDEFYNDWSGK